MDETIKNTKDLVSSYLLSEPTQLYKTDTFQFDLKKINSKIDSIIDFDGNLKREKTKESHKKLSKFTNKNAPPISVFNDTYEKEKIDYKDNVEFRHVNKFESKNVNPSNKNLKNLSRTDNLPNLSNKRNSYNNFKDRVISPDKNNIKIGDASIDILNNLEDNKSNKIDDNIKINKLEFIIDQNLKKEDSIKKSDNAKNKKKSSFFCCF